MPLSLSNSFTGQTSWQGSVLAWRMSEQEQHPLTNHRPFVQDFVI
jgi:hypothetical protein